MKTIYKSILPILVIIGYFNTLYQFYKTTEDMNILNAISHIVPLIVVIFLFYYMHITDKWSKFLKINESDLKNYKSLSEKCSKLMGWYHNTDMRFTTTKKQVEINSILINCLMDKLFNSPEHHNLIANNFINYLESNNMTPDKLYDYGISEKIINEINLINSQKQKESNYKPTKKWSKKF